MKNYCDKLKKIVKGYYDYKLKELNEKDENMQRYSPAVYGEKNAELDEKATEKCLQALEKIETEYEKAKAALGWVDLLDGEQLAHPDRALLNDNILRPSVFDVRGLMERHSHDFSFLKVLKTWLQEQSAIQFTELADEIRTPYDLLMDITEYSRLSMNKCISFNGSREQFELTITSYLEDFFTSPLVSRITNADLDIEATLKMIPDGAYTPFQDQHLTTHQVEQYRNNQKMKTTPLMRRA